MTGSKFRVDNKHPKKPGDNSIDTEKEEQTTMLSAALQPKGDTFPSSNVSNSSNPFSRQATSSFPECSKVDI